MTGFQPIIKWSGSKRHIVKFISSLFPKNINTFFDPFVGGGSMLRSISADSGVRVIASDICSPLIDLWKILSECPEKVIEGYEQRWRLLADEMNAFKLGPDVINEPDQKYQQSKIYYEIRSRFNQNNDPFDFFFLTRTCYNGLIRFNRNAEFNSSFHLSRQGIAPRAMSKIILDWIPYLKRTTWLNIGFDESIARAAKGDLIFFDPPYLNTQGMYAAEKFNHDQLWLQLDRLNSSGINWVLTFDGDVPSDVLIKIPYKQCYQSPNTLSSFRRMKKQAIQISDSIFTNY